MKEAKEATSRGGSWWEADPLTPTILAGRGPDPGRKKDFYAGLRVVLVVRGKR